MMGNKVVDYSNLQKQLLYPKFFERFFSSAVDLLVISAFINITLKPLLEPITYWIFKYNFNDFIIRENLNFTSARDIESIIYNPGFIMYMNSFKLFIYMCQLSTIQYIIVSSYFLISWYYYNSTLGKLIFRIKIVDYNTLESASLKQYIIRYVACITYPLGIWWSLFSREGRALHDRLSNTIVIKK